MEPHLFHPVAVHFPVALLIAGLAFEAAWWKRRADWLEKTASWLLWPGAAGAWAAVGLGFLAERTAPHVPAAWETLAHHESLALWAAGSFTALAVWRARWRTKGRALFLAAWLAAEAVLLNAAFHGGELVFRHGMGVTPDSASQHAR